MKGHDLQFKSTQQYDTWMRLEQKEAAIKYLALLKERDEEYQKGVAFWVIIPLTIICLIYVFILAFIK